MISPLLIGLVVGLLIGVSIGLWLGAVLFTASDGTGGP